MGIPCLVRLASFLLALVIAGLPAHAGVNKWTRIGLNKLSVFTLAADPVDPSIVYAGTNHGPSGRGRGIFKTTDSGIHWEQIGQDLLSPYGHANIVFLQVDPHDPNTVYALLGGGDEMKTGWFKSTNGGATWTSCPSFPPMTSLFIHPSQPSTLYGTRGQGVSRSTDGGLTWTTYLRGLGGWVTSVQAAPDGTMIALAEKVYRSSDRGETWHEWINYRALCLTFDPTDPANIYLGRCQTTGLEPGILKSTDGGATWYDYSQGFSIVADGYLVLYEPAEAIWIDPLDPTHLFALRGTNGFGIGSSVYTSLDGGNTWNPMGLECRSQYEPPVNKTALSSLLVLDGSASTLYVGYQDYEFDRDPRDLSGLYASTYAPGAQFPDLAVTTQPIQDASSIFEVAKSASYRVTVTNNGTGPTTGPITVADFLPAGMSFTSHEGASWDCSAAGTSVTCSRTISLAAGSSDSFLLRVGVGLPAAGIVTNKVVVDTPADNNAEDNVAYTPVTVTKDPGVLHLHAGRFQVEVQWQTTLGSGEGTARVLSADSGYFWFFEPTNMELLVKVLDGRSVNHSFWVFYGSLTDVAFTVRITDLVTGRIQTYQNSQGRQASFHDVSAFPDNSTPGAAPLYTGLAAGDPSLIGHWKFDDPANTALDSSGYENHLDEAIPFVPGGRVGGCAGGAEGAASTTFRLGDGLLADIMRSGPITTVAWVNLGKEDTDNGNPLLSNQYGYSYSHQHGEVFGLYASLNVFGGRIGGDFLGASVDAGAQAQPGVWHHLALTYDGEYTRFFLDGQAVCTVQRYIEMREVVWQLGSSKYGHSGDYAGLIDDLRIYSRALGPEEIAVLAAESAETPDMVLDSRFTVRVDWTTAAGATGTAFGIPLSRDSGYFWFFDKSNAELLVKILDGRSVNGKFWVFFASLTDVAYTVRITDTETGAVRVYTGTQGIQSSGYDLEAF
ncbi:MAG: DUF11 domain-containing protein [Acidobacteria bacterium]|nr:MAG: DUF11 domain-containing protein [Acidobacteriota bacterium]